MSAFCLVLPLTKYYRSTLITTAVRFLTPFLGELQDSIFITPLEKTCVIFHYECRARAESASIGAAATGPASTGAASTGAAVGPWHGRLSSAVGSSRHLRWRPPAPRCPAPSSTSLGLELMLSPGICLRPTCPTSGVRAHPPLAHNASCRRRRRRRRRRGGSWSSDRGFALRGP